MIESGYTPVTIQGYARAAAHLSYGQHGRAQSLKDLDATDIGKFTQHLRACQCKRFRRVNEYDLRGAQKFLRHLQQTAVISVTARSATAATTPTLFVTFCDWMRPHNGTRDTPLETYRQTIVDALQATTGP
jgi:integrase/recombinase XerD